MQFNCTHSETISVAVTVTLSLKSETFTSKAQRVLLLTYFSKFMHRFTVLGVDSETNCFGRQLGFTELLAQHSTVPITTISGLNLDWVVDHPKFHGMTNKLQVKFCWPKSMVHISLLVPLKHSVTGLFCKLHVRHRIWFSLVHGDRYDMRPMWRLDVFN